MASEQTENPTRGTAMAGNEHAGEAETRVAILDIAAGEQRPGGGRDGAGLGESGQDAAWEGQESQGKSREEEENERTDREFSETIEKLDSVLLEEAGGKEGNSDGDRTDLSRTEEVSTKTDEPKGVTSAQVAAGETFAQVAAGETFAQVAAGETFAQVAAGETFAQVAAGETSAQVVAAGETSAQVVAGETSAQVAESEVPTEETFEQVLEEDSTLQVPEETAAQVPLKGGTEHASLREAPVVEAERETTESAEETAVQVSEETSHHSEVTHKETCPQVTTEEDVSPQPVEGTGAAMYDIVTSQVTEASEAWIDTLVKNIVTEVTSEGTGAGDDQAHVSGESTDSSSEPAEAEEHSCASRTTILEQEQVTLEETGAAMLVTDLQPQVSYDNIVIAAQEVTGPPGPQVGPSSTGGVTVSPLDQEAGRQVESPGQEAHGEVTPDLVTVPGREGTSDPGQPAACREKEWPPLICTGSEVRAETAEQKDTEQGTVPEKEQCPGAADMKDREVVEDGVVLTPETPIEREIRLAMEREMSLRQERGISVPVGEPELVEVRRKTVVLKPEALPGKERQLAGAQMQREIQLETQREQDLVEQGKVIGMYDRGPQQELQEKKMIFESMKTESSDPPLKRRQSEMQKSDSIEAVVEAPAPSNHVYSAAPTAEVKKGPSYAEANGSNIIIIEHASILRKSTPGNVHSTAPPDLQSTSPAQSRRSTPADLRFTRSSSGNSPRSESPVAAPGSPFQLLSSPSPRSLLEREIEEVQERERELRKQRTSIYGRDNGTTENSQIASNSDIQSGIYQPERPSWGKLEVNWPPNKSMTINGQQDQAWDSPRTRRQRSALIQSWESGNPNRADDN